MMRAGIAALAMGGLMATSTLAQTPTLAPVPPVKPADKVICKRVDVSGTRVQLPKKCMTRKDWDRLDGRGKEDMDAAIRASLTRNAVGGG